MRGERQQRHQQGRQQRDQGDAGDTEGVVAAQAHPAAAAEAALAAQVPEPARGSRDGDRRSAISERELEQIMVAIDDGEAKLHDLTQALVTATESGDWTKIRELDDAYREQEAVLSSLIAKWEQLEAVAS